MKKLALVLSVFAVVGLASCSKKRICECKQSVDGVVAQTLEMEVEGDECSSLNSTISNAFGTTKTECVEK